MDEYEAEVVLRTLATADGGCVDCAGKLFSKFVAAFPSFEQLARDLWLELEMSEECEIRRWWT